MGEQGVSPLGAFHHRANTVSQVRSFLSASGPVRKPLEEIHHAFLCSEFRNFTTIGTVSLHANTYEVGPVLAGTTVELAHDPFDLDLVITDNNLCGAGIQ